MSKRFHFLTRTLWLVSLISLFTDMASEMLYPIMPLYLKQIGFSMIGLGFLEGLAEALAGFSKPYFGHWSDKLQRRTPFVQWGYALSALAKPAMGFFQSAGAVFFLRSADRLGKGIRSGARDALLSDISANNDRGKVFGWHRAMDTVGAVVGPALALLFLAYYPGQYHMLFLWALVPGIFAVGLTFFIKDNLNAIPTNTPPFKFTFATAKSIWQQSSSTYKQVLIGLTFIALVNSSDMFLIFRAVELGLTETEAVMAYLFYNLIFAVAAYPMGYLADRIGFKPMLLGGFVLLALVYTALILPLNQMQFAGTLVLYGLYAAATEGLSKAWISTLCLPSQKAGALGLFQGFQSIGVWVASSVCGWLWYTKGSQWAFAVTVVGVLLGLIVLFRIKLQKV